MDRFWSKVAKTDGCWLWTASTARGGYGQLRVGNTTVRAHRLSYELAFGSIPNGMSILHACDEPLCVNPAHLRAGTDADNMQDAVARGRHSQVRKTRCPRGHAYDAGNTYARPDGARVCRPCKNAANRSYRARQKETQ